MVETISEQPSERAFTVSGPTCKGALMQLVLKPVPEEAARDADSTRVVANRTEGLSSRVLQFIGQ